MKTGRCLKVSEIHIGDFEIELTDGPDAPVVLDLRIDELRWLIDCLTRLVASAGEKK